MKKQKGFVVPFIIIMVVALSVGGGFYYKNSIVKSDTENVVDSTNVSTETNTDTNNLSETRKLTSILSGNIDTVNVNAGDKISANVSSGSKISTNTDSTSVDKDIQTVSEIMQRYKIAYESGNVTILNTFYSKATLDLFTNLGGDISVNTNSKIKIGNITRSGKNIKVEAVETKSNGSIEEQSYVFILENGQWKIDLAASIESDVQKSSAYKSDPAGYIDLVVTGIKVYPSKPIVNDENVEIEVTIKNIGTKISEKGAPLIATVLENTKYTPTQGGSLAPLGAGESVTWKFNMYSQNKRLNLSDVAGKKTVVVELNILDEVIEKNYNNNKFTYTFEVFSE